MDRPNPASCEGEPSSIKAEQEHDCEAGFAARAQCSVLTVLVLVIGIRDRIMGTSAARIAWRCGSLACAIDSSTNYENR